MTLERKCKSNKHIFRIGVIFIVLAIFMLTSCDANTKEKEVEIEGIKLEDKTFIYDGEIKKLEIEGVLPENIIASYLNNNQTEAGRHIVVVEFTDLKDTNKKFKELKAILTIEPKEIQISFDDREFTYDGTEKDVKINEHLPNGITVEYINNNQINAGKYEVQAKFNNDNPNYKPLPDLTATLTIHKAKCDVEFNGEFYLYDGKEKELGNVVGDLPEGITASYSNRKMTEPGILEVTVTFSGENSQNYESSRKAYLVIYDENIILTNEIKDLINEGKFKSIFYGSYPQTVVDDEILIVELDKLTQTNANGYYEYNGNEFAKQTAMPYDSNYKFSNGETIVKNKTYYFKVEPIKWRILEQADGTLTLLTDMILDLQQFSTSWKDRIIDGKTIYANNYEHSTIREWLNNDFYNKAFNNINKELILTTHIDNSASTTDNSTNKYACDDTYDKVYLLSYKEGYTYFNNDNERQAIASDYARARHVYVSNNYSYWWLRSPDYYYFDYAYDVSNSGSILDYYVHSTTRGARPALKIKID